MEAVGEPFRTLERTGVIYVMTEAVRSGYKESDPAWINLGQGQPEVGALPDAPKRIESIPIETRDLEYAPVDGLLELRQAVAEYYNATYRRGLKSQYSVENVCIAPGGRAALARAAAVIGRVNLGHFLPDYTAYEELLDQFKGFIPIPISLEPETCYKFSPADLEKEIRGRGLGMLLLSNPCNPTGKVLCGDELSQWLHIARELSCGMIFDEFYSMYLWNGMESVSAAAHVEDVNKDPVLLINGLTKNWRYPGLRIAWALGPKPVIDAMGSAGSFMDGGACRPVQRVAAQLVCPDQAKGERLALQREFLAKRKLMLEGLKALGVTFELEPEGTFYCWGNISNFPEPLRDGIAFFRACLAQKVITVPGEFFDVDPGGRRSRRPSRFQNYVRFSFGGSREKLETGLARLAQILT